MTWTMKLRGDPTGTITHEYLCPVHGRFDVEVKRVEVPDSVTCSAWLWPAEDVHPSNHHYVPRCGLSSPWSPSGIVSRVKQGEVSQGKIETAGLPGHVCMDTRPLADGMPLAEFKAQRAKLHAELAVSKMRQLTGRTRKVMR